MGLQATMVALMCVSTSCGVVSVITIGMTMTPWWLAAIWAIQQLVCFYSFTYD